MALQYPTSSAFPPTSFAATTAAEDHSQPSITSSSSPSFSRALKQESQEQQEVSTSSAASSTQRYTPLIINLDDEADCFTISDSSDDEPILVHSTRNTSFIGRPFYRGLLDSNRQYQSPNTSVISCSGGNGDNISDFGISSSSNYLKRKFKSESTMDHVYANGDSNTLVCTINDLSFIITKISFSSNTHRIKSVLSMKAINLHCRKSLRPVHPNQIGKEIEI